jgi:hypothetical protein
MFIGSPQQLYARVGRFRQKPQLINACHKLADEPRDLGEIGGLKGCIG